VPALDEAALVGFPAADALLGLGGHPTQLYLRAAPDQVQPVVSVLPFTANPAQPEAVQVSLPSSILAARAAARTAYAGLFLGLGAVAVLVGGVGIANIMVIAVLERRAEIGLRHALGATRRRVGLQFLTESVLLSALAGAAGVLAGHLTHDREGFNTPGSSESFVIMKRAGSAGAGGGAGVGVRARVRPRGAGPGPGDGGAPPSGTARRPAAPRRWPGLSGRC